jgi:uncharacterized protein (DUF433 family)
MDNERSTRWQWFLDLQGGWGNGSGPDGGNLLALTGECLWPRRGNPFGPTRGNPFGLGGGILLALDTLLDRITLDPKVLAGKPIIRGMRISVEQILNLLGQGMTYEDILKEYPVLEEADIKASLLYARELMSVEKVYRVESQV